MTRYNITCNIKTAFWDIRNCYSNNLVPKTIKIEYLQRLGICSNEIKALYLDTSINLK